MGLKCKVVPTESYYYKQTCCCPLCLESGKKKVFCVVIPFMVGHRNYLVDSDGEVSYHPKAAKLFCCKEDAKKFIEEHRLNELSD